MRSCRSIRPRQSCGESTYGSQTDGRLQKNWMTLALAVGPSQMDFDTQRAHAHPHNAQKCSPSGMSSFCAEKCLFREMSFRTLPPSSHYSKAHLSGVSENALSPEGPQNSSVDQDMPSILRRDSRAVMTNTASRHLPASLCHPSYGQFSSHKQFVKKALMITIPTLCPLTRPPDGLATEQLAGATAGQVAKTTAWTHLTPQVFLR